MFTTITKENIKVNLIDIGCNVEQIDYFMNMFQKQNIKEALEFLKIHRSTILKKVHEEQKKIDNLDYLVYLLKKGSEK